MAEQLGPEDERAEQRAKFRRAAYKAWRKIRASRRQAASEGAKPLEHYVPVRVVTSLQHPELVRLARQEQKPTTFGKGIVSLFHKTPADIACGPFWELRWAFGCPLDCNYCYLRGTMRGRMKPSFIKVDQIVAALDEAFASIDKPAIFNAGELSDALMNPAIMAQIADRFDMQDRHKLGILSKFGPKNVQFLLEKRRRNVICAWSLNPSEVAERWERAAAPPDKRIEAARLVHDAGYDTRIRLDPMFPIPDWKTHYEDLLYRLFERLTPRRMILGTPRGLWKTIKYAQAAGVDMSWTEFFREDSGWGKKLAFAQRLELYSYVYDKLAAIGYDIGRVTMCKETIDMWRALGLKYTPLTCNCYGPHAIEA